MALVPKEPVGVVPVQGAGISLPDRPGNRGPTAGLLYDGRRRLVRQDALVSGRDDSLLDDLELPDKARRAEAMFSHVEAKVAAMMRRGEAPQHSVVIINNAKGPCGWWERRRGKPKSGTNCDELLSGILPAGSTLTVGWRDRDGVLRWQVYRGTGENIRRRDDLHD